MSDIHTEPTEQQEQTAADQKPSAKGEDSVSMMEVLFDLAGSMLFAMVLLLLTMTFFLRQVTVDGASMNDTLHDQERLLVSCYDYTPRCGDIVVITHGEHLQEPIIKRVIATEGQTITIDYATGDVTVDGVLLKESYILGTTGNPADGTMTPSSASTEFTAQVPQGYVFVMGDNREHSLDSRSATVGMIPVENIMGKAVFRIYPFQGFGAL